MTDCGKKNSIPKKDNNGRSSQYPQVVEKHHQHLKAPTTFLRITFRVIALGACFEKKTSGRRRTPDSVVSEGVWHGTLHSRAVFVSPSNLRGIFFRGESEAIGPQMPPKLESGRS